MNFNSFLQKITPELLDNGFSVLLHKTHNLDGWSGWMIAEEKEKEFVVAIDHPFGFETAIHEYCHYLQYKYKPNLWFKPDTHYDLLIDWVDDMSLEYTDKQLNQSLYDILELEYDCETMSIEFAYQNNIENFDIDKYCRGANAYLWHYHINKQFRKRPKEPIYTARVLDSMSNKLEKDLSFYLDINNLSLDKYQALLNEYP